MFNVWFMTSENVKGVLSKNGLPVAFSNEDAWTVIAEIMHRDKHPKFMWLEVANGNN